MESFASSRLKRLRIRDKPYWEPLYSKINFKNNIANSILYDGFCGVFRKLQTPPEIMRKLPISGEIFCIKHLNYIPSMEYYLF